MRRFAIAVVFAAALSNGCGTVANFTSGDPQVYGGLQKDLEWSEGLVSAKPSTENHWPSAGQNAGWAAAVVLGIFAAEPVLSFTCDTLTLPIVMCLRSPRPAAAPSDPSGRAEPAFSTAAPVD